MEIGGDGVVKRVLMGLSGPPVGGEDWMVEYMGSRWDEEGEQIEPKCFRSGVCRQVCPPAVPSWVQSFAF